jgi:hypothetical protein
MATGLGFFEAGMGITVSFMLRRSRA